MQAEIPTTPMQRFLQRIANVEPHECAAVIAAFCLFFCVLGGYFAVRPVRETIGTLLGRERVSFLWTFTGIGALVIVPIYGWLVAKVRRTVLLPWIYGTVAVSLLLVASVLRADEGNLQVGAFFYVWISVLNLLLVSVFWSFLLELFESGQAKRLFGFIAAGGTAGGLIGPLITDLTVERIGNSGVLVVGAAGFVAAIFFQRMLLAIWFGQQRSIGNNPDRAIGGNPFAGISIVFKSPYLLAIALFVVLLSAVNTFLYFEQLRLVEENFANTADRTQFFARMDYVVQTLTILSQVVLTGWIASRFGIRALLTVVPLVMVVGFLLLASFGTLSMLAIVFVVRRWGEYAFIRPGREMLWSKLDTETKYKAKSFIDVPVYRVADAVGSSAKTWLETAGLSPAGAAVLGAGLAAGWAINGLWLGRKADSK